MGLGPGGIPPCGLELPGGNGKVLLHGCLVPLLLEHPLAEQLSKEP